MKGLLKETTMRMMMEKEICLKKKSGDDQCEREVEL